MLFSLYFLNLMYFSMVSKSSQSLIPNGMWNSIFFPFPSSFYLQFSHVSKNRSLSWGSFYYYFFHQYVSLTIEDNEFHLTLLTLYSSISIVHQSNDFSNHRDLIINHKDLITITIVWKYILTLSIFKKNFSSWYISLTSIT
jgi:hypothetical protein